MEGKRYGVIRGCYKDFLSHIPTNSSINCRYGGSGSLTILSPELNEPNDLRSLPEYIAIRTCSDVNVINETCNVNLFYAIGKQEFINNLQKANCLPLSGNFLIYCKYKNKYNIV